MSTNRKLFEEAIADAKAVKEMAIKNAKTALEESFAPHLQKMLSAKLNEMESEETKDEVTENEEVTEVEETNEVNTNDEIDLDELLKELESTETNLEEAAETEVEEPETEEVTDEETVSVADMSEEDLKKVVEDTIKEMVAAGEIEAGPESEDEEVEVEAETEEEEVDLDEILKEINSKEENLDEAKKKPVKKDEKKVVKKDDKDLKEALAELNSLKSEMNEVNLLNAKLLYTNKIFKAKNLNESQKLKVLSSFDKAQTVAESKLVYETILESLKEVKTNKPIVESKGSASKTIIKPTASTTPIVTDLAFKRMQELAFGQTKY